eukprot:64015-Rhodomonas_salina.1
MVSENCWATEPPGTLCPLRLTRHPTPPTTRSWSNEHSATQRCSRYSITDLTLCTAGSQHRSSNACAMSSSSSSC